jgi:transcriptional regulator with XRE-family HTH domain/tetratricopeptide (TPR) repeat protein
VQHIDREDVKALVWLLEGLCGSGAGMAAATGLHGSTLWRYERGKATPPRATLERLAAAAAMPMWVVDGVLLPAIALARSLSREPENATTPADAANREEGETALDAALAVAARVAVARFLAAQEANNGAGGEPRPQQDPLAAAPWTSLAPEGTDGTSLPVELRRELLDLCTHLCEQSARAAAHAAAQALELAHLALRIAEIAPGDAAWRSRLLGYVWAFVANARRVADDLEAAEAALAAAWRLWHAGAAAQTEPLGEWRLLDLEASLRRDRRQFPAALERLDRALALAPQEAHGHILLKRAFTLEQAGDVQAALVTLQGAAPLVEKSAEPRDRWVLCINLLVNLCHLGRHAEAEAQLSALRELTHQLGNKLDSLRVRWLGGRVAAGRGRRDEARATFEEVSSEFAALANDYNAALVALELALLHLEEGRTQEVRTLAAGMVSIFRSKSIHREALAALALFCRAAEAETATAELARRVLAYLERARRNPELKFDDVA